ncbi:tetratricopeptide repeat protein [Paraburkholderia monticola]|uniref:tetratricopeptide repeat protein n=1 Tax=Paraburkholderia monticola TaxID=1399968 RepID=UPI00094F50C0|nr:tetratricopeptide repeat protein [Paraburkholderia monticola]
MTDSPRKRYATFWKTRSIALVLLLFGFAGCATSSGQLVHGDTGAETKEYVTNAENAEAHLEFKEAIGWYEKAAALGDAKSMNELGWIYFGAHDIPGRQLKDYSRARSWFERAAGLNYVPAITQLGVMYNGDGSMGAPADHVKAARLFLEAARAGDAQAMNNLGLLYLQGKGVRQNVNEAVYWWRKAVEVDKNGPSGRAAQSWLDLHDGKCLFPLCRAPVNSAQQNNVH